MLLMIVFGGIELLFLKLCYNKLLKPELLGLHLGRELRRAGVNMIRLPFLYFTESFSKGIGREKERHQEIHIEMEKAVELLGMEFIIISCYPMILSVLVSGTAKDMGIWMALFISFAGESSILKQIYGTVRNKRQSLVFYLGNLPEWNDFVQTIWRERRNVLSVKKFTYMILLVMLGFSMMISTWKLYQILPSKAAFFMCTVGGMWILFHEMRQKKKQVNQEILVEGEYLNKYRNEIGDLCGQMHIQNLLLEECEREIVASVSKEASGRWHILVGRDTISELQKSNLESAGMKMILAHELIHIKYRDDKNMGLRKAAFGSLVLIYVFLIVYAVVLKSGLAAEISLCFGCLLVVHLLASSIYANEKYWKQLTELRADKLGMELAEIGVDEWKEINQILMKKRDYAKEYFENDRNKLFGYYLKYGESNGYPCWERRVKAIEKENRWGCYFYFWLFREILTGLLRKEGGYGR